MQAYACNLEENLFGLREELRSGTYLHSGYTQFYITDPKLRHIHKPAVKDRVLHHALVALLDPIFERLFIFDSYSSRRGKGTHLAIARLRELCWKESQHNTRTVWALKCDVRKFFDSVDHGILLSILGKRVRGEVFSVLEQVVRSFEIRPGKGIPLGNLTSQLFSNVYLDRLDQFVKRELKVKSYLRYADDFVLVSHDRAYLEGLLPRIEEFLGGELKLELHARKVIFRRWRQGIDFLGYISFPNHTLLRHRTRQRMLRNTSRQVGRLAAGKIAPDRLDRTLESYYGMLRHCRGRAVFDALEEALGPLRGP